MNIRTKIQLVLDSRQYTVEELLSLLKEASEVIGALEEVFKTLEKNTLDNRP